MNFKSWKEWVENFDALLTAVGGLCKRHWGKLIIIAIFGSIYYVWGHPMILDQIEGKDSTNNANRVDTVLVEKDSVIHDTVRIPVQSFAPIDSTEADSTSN